MKIKRSQMCLLVFVTALCLLCGCGGTEDRPDTDVFGGIPQEVGYCISNYLETWRTEGASVSGELCYFMYEEERNARLASDTELESYTVDRIEEINPELYAVTVSYVTLRAGWEEADIHSANNFAGKIDGEWKFIVNRRSVPEQISINFDSTKYSISDENVLDDEQTGLTPID